MKQNGDFISATGYPVEKTDFSREVIGTMYATVHCPKSNRFNIDPWKGNLMPDLAKVLTDNSVQTAVHQALRQRPGFQVEYHLPDFLREKLERLDRVTAELSKP